MAELYLSRTPYTFLGFSASRDRTPFTIVGIPFDSTSSYRSGARWAPLHIRLASQSLESYSLFSGIDVEEFGFEDLGDVVVSHGNVEETLRRIEVVVDELLKSGRIVVALGGEHTVSIGLARAFAKNSRNPAMLVFDAHLDLRQSYLGSRLCHATVMRVVSDELSMPIIFVATRAVTLEELEYAKAKGLEILSMKDLRSLGVSQASRKIAKLVEPYSEIYVSIDMDFIDPAYAPGVQTPEPLGLSSWEALELLTSVVDDRVKLIDVVEVTPPYDVGESTSFLAAKVVLELCAKIYTELKHRANRSF